MPQAGRLRTAGPRRHRTHWAGREPPPRARGRGRQGGAGVRRRRPRPLTGSRRGHQCTATLGPPPSNPCPDRQHLSLDGDSGAAPPLALTRRLRPEARGTCPRRRDVSGGVSMPAPSPRPGGARAPPGEVDAPRTGTHTRWHTLTRPPLRRPRRPHPLAWTRVRGARRGTHPGLYRVSVLALGTRALAPASCA